MANKKLTEVDVSTSLDSIFVNDGGKVRQINKENINNIIKGVPGKSAYQYAQDGGYTGTEEEFAQKLAEEYPTDVQINGTSIVGEDGVADISKLLDETLTHNTKAAPAGVVGELKGDLDTLNQGGLNLKEDFIGQQVNEWLDNHPEATTTVQDGVITEKKFSNEVFSEIYGTKSDVQRLKHCIVATTKKKYLDTEFKIGDKVRITAPSPTVGSTEKEQLHIGYVTEDGTEIRIFDSNDLNDAVDIVYTFTNNAVQLYTSTWNWNDIEVNVYSISEEYENGLIPDVAYLKNTVVTPQMFGACGDGSYDDTVSIQKALDYSECVYFPAGIYYTSDTLNLHDNQVLFGCGRESKIVNTVLNGDSKTIISTGNVAVGEDEKSYLNLPKYECTINDDMHSVTVVNNSDINNFKIGDIIFISNNDFSKTKNPSLYWNTIITSISESSLVLDSYIENDLLMNEELYIRNMSNYPLLFDEASRYKVGVTKDVCIHDVSLEHKYYNSGSGMYCIGLCSYNASVYNVWTRGNTAIGSNYSVNLMLDNITAEFDGGFCDIPEINQNVVVQNCVGNKYGRRLNENGITFLQGYGVTIRNNRMKFNGYGGVKVGSHIRPTIKDNEFYDVALDNPPIYLSFFGNSKLLNNIITCANTPRTSSNVVFQNGTGNIIKGNIIDNNKGQRWMYGFNDFDHFRNNVDDNILTKDFGSDAYFDMMPGNRLGTSAMSFSGFTNTYVIKPNTNYVLSSNSDPLYPRLKYIKLMLSKACDFTLTFEFVSGTKSINFSSVSVLDIYIPKENYITYILNNTQCGRYTTNLNHRIKTISINQKSDSDINILGYIFKDLKY